MKNKFKKRLRKALPIFGVEFLILFLFIVLIVAFWPSMYTKIIVLKEAVDDYQSSIPIINTDEPTVEELDMVVGVANSAEGMRSAVIDFVLVSLLFLLVLFVGVSMLFFVQERLLKRVKIFKKDFYLGLLKWISVMLGFGFFTVFYFVFFSYVFGRSGFVDTNLALTVIFWLYVIISSFLIHFCFILFCCEKKKFSKVLLVKLFRDHSLYVLGFLVYVYVVKKLIEISFDFGSISKLLVIFLVLVLTLILQFSFAYEKVCLTE